MKWVTPLYIGKAASSKKAEIIRGIKAGNAPSDSYALILPPSGYDQLDIIRTLELKNDYYKNQEIIIIGIAFGRDDAIDLVARIVNDSMRLTGKADIKEFLKARQREAGR